MQLFWPKEMKSKPVSIGRPPIDLQRHLEMQVSQDLNLKLFRRFVSGRDLCPPSGGRGHLLVASSSVYLLYLCGGPCPLGSGFDGIAPSCCSPLDYRLLPRREERDRGSLSPRTYEILIW